jgi:carbon-monoxide dehydrogenase medium subunit
MKPPPFTYCAPASVEEAISLLAEYGDEAKLLAGGQSLVPLMNMRLARPTLLIDITRIPELNYVVSDEQYVRIGATTPQIAVQHSKDVIAHTPVMADALRFVGHQAIRSRGTLGGSVAHADPAAELPAVAVALRADIVARGPTGTRSIPSDDFFLSHFTTALSDDEVITELRFPRPHSSLRWGFTEIARRHGDFALVGVAAATTAGVGAGLAEPRVVISGVDSAPLRAKRLEDWLGASELGDSLDFREIGPLVVDDVRDATSDIHATASYRREVAGVLARRAVESMLAEPGGANGH